MRSVETKILRSLIFITLFLFLYKLIFSIFIPFITPKGSLNDYEFFGFVITFFGLHTFFALCTFISTRLPVDNKLSLITLGASIFIPAIYFVLNINYLSTLNISSFIVILFSSLIFDFIRKDAEGNNVRKYIKVLINPFHLEDEIF
tara:strand:- start:62 stop:499 length:438 start_codon:yes stop_codon:yes gene_type:complete